MISCSLSFAPLRRALDFCSEKNPAVLLSAFSANAHALLSTSFAHDSSFFFFCSHLFNVFPFCFLFFVLLRFLLHLLSPPGSPSPSLPTPSYSVLVSISISTALSTVFHSINSLNNSPLFRSLSPVLFLCLIGRFNCISLYESLLLQP